MTLGVSPSKARLLERAAARVANDKRFMASVFLDWTGGNVDFSRLAQSLDCDAAAVTRIALCFRPRSEPAAFREDVARIAAEGGVQERRLLALISEADALAAFRLSARVAPSMLAAARDNSTHDQNDAGGKK